MLIEIWPPVTAAHIHRPNSTYGTSLWMEHGPHVQGSAEVESPPLQPELPVKEMSCSDLLALESTAYGFSPQDRVLKNVDWDQIQDPMD